MRNKIAQIFSLLGQEHLISDLDHFSEGDLEKCHEQISEWNIEELQSQKKSWANRRDPMVFESLSTCPMACDQLVHPVNKKSAVIILAGGQGSRLGVSGPKGCYPLLGKSLFERLAEKIRPRNTLLSIMTSSINHEETFSFFQNHQHFGLEGVSFFSQKTLPLLNEEGRFFWQAQGKIAEGADGNGSVFQAFAKAGLLKRFLNEGIELVHIVPVDNVLADPLDSSITSFHCQELSELTIKCIRLTDALEPLGRLVRVDGALQIAEFAELSLEQQSKNLIANTGLLLLDLAFIAYLSKQSFPLHWAYRSTTSFENGKFIKKMAWKAERFVVDSLRFTKKSSILGYDRDDCFAPLKEKQSVAEIERLLEMRNRV